MLQSNWNDVKSYSYVYRLLLFSDEQTVADDDDDYDHDNKCDHEGENGDYIRY